MSKVKTWTVERNIKTGFVLTGPHRYVYPQERHLYETIPPFEFQDTLKFKDWGRGRSSAYFEFEGEKHLWYTGMDGLSSIVPHMVNGVVTGTFCFRKQGDAIYVHFLKG